MGRMEALGGVRWVTVLLAGYGNHIERIKPRDNPRFAKATGRLSHRRRPYLSSLDTSLNLDAKLSG